MTDEEKKAWEECVARTKRSCRLELLPADNVYSLVLSVDDELIRLRAEVDKLRDAVEWALSASDRDMNYDYVMTELRRRIDPYAAQRAYEDQHDRIKMGKKKWNE
jgi:hypothetical protein